MFGQNVKNQNGGLTMKFQHSLIIPKESAAEVSGEGGNWRLEYEKGKFLSFIHLPKTGGISIWDWVQKNFGESNYWKSPHMPYSRMHEVYGKEDMDLGFVFGIIRNPYDWTVSRWAHYIASRNHTPETLPFEKYLELSHVKDSEGLPEVPPRPKYHIEDFINYLKGANYIIRYEFLEDEFNLIKEMTGCYKELGSMNVSKFRFGDKDYRKYYTPRCKEIVETCYLDVMKEYNYEW